MDHSPTDLPPKVLRYQARGLVGAPPGAAPPVGPDGRPDLSSLPVLNAFQTFLDKERRTMQRRLAALALFMIALFLALGAAAGLVGAHFFVQIAERVRLTQVQIESLHSAAAGLRRDTGEELRRVKEEAERLLRRLDERQPAWDAASAAAEQGARQAAALEDLRGAFQDLAASNAALRAELAALRARLEQPPPAPRPEPAAAAPQPRPPSPPPRAAVFAPATGVLTLAVSPPRPADPLPWMLLIPE